MTAHRVDDLGRKFFVKALDAFCELTHPVTHRRPWLWLMEKLGVHNGWCLLAKASAYLDERWGTDVWESGDDPDVRNSTRRGDR